jgi:hypothetical protein
MGQNFQDPLAAYVYGQTGIPGAFTTGLEQFGFLGAPYGGVEKNYASQEQFQQLLKNVFDAQMQSFPGSNNNVNALPFNLRSLFTGAAPYLTDPWYGVLGAAGMLSNGYQQGAFPNNPTAAHRIYSEQAQGYPNYPAPDALRSLTGMASPFYQGGFPPAQPPQAQTAAQAFAQNYPTQASINNPSNALVGHYTVPLAGGGSMTVNASSPQAAAENVKAQGGNVDTGGNITGQAPRAPSLTG